VERKYRNWIIVISLAIPLVVGLLMYAPIAGNYNRSWVEWLPHINAVINALTSVLLIAGVVFIKSGSPVQHKQCMLAAFTLGMLFLISYIIYHSTVPSTSFGGEGVVRIIYYVLLISHILLAIVVVPFVLLALYHAWREDFVRHKKIVKITFPVWLYVSVSGVLVYLMISPYYG